MAGWQTLFLSKPKMMKNNDYDDAHRDWEVCWCDDDNDDDAKASF